MVKFISKSILLPAVMLTSSAAFSMEIPAETIATNIGPESTIEEIRGELKEMKIPVFDFRFEEDAFPTFDVVYPDPGYNGVSITNNEYVQGSLTITFEADTLYDSGAYESKKSGVRVKARGNTSTAMDYYKRKSYKVKLSKKADLLLRGNDDLKDKDWVLLGNGSDKLKWVASTEIGRIAGMPWEPAGRHVAVIMNDKYMGHFYLAEAVSAGKHRVDIDDSGYVIEDDAYFWKPDEVYFKSNHLTYDLGWTFKEPDTDDFDEMSLDNIKWAVNNVEKKLYAGENVEDLIDYESFARWILVHDIICTTDGYGSNIFVQKKDFDVFAPFSSKIEMGPHWDFDTSLETNANTLAPIHTLPGFWYCKLSDDPAFQEKHEEAWRLVRENLRELTLSAVKKYLEENPDLYHIRLIDDNLDLLAPHVLTYPEANYNDLEEWLDKRVAILDYLILGEGEDPSGVTDVPADDTDTDQETASGIVARYNIEGQPVSRGYKGVTISLDNKGRTTKTIR